MRSEVFGQRIDLCYLCKGTCESLKEKREETELFETFSQVFGIGCAFLFSQQSILCVILQSILFTPILHHLLLNQPSCSYIYTHSFLASRISSFCAPFLQHTLIHVLRSLFLESVTNLDRKTSSREKICRNRVQISL